MPRHPLCALFSLTLQFTFCVCIDLSTFQRSFINSERHRSFKTEHDLRTVYAIKAFLLRKEVIHPHVPVGIPCYDLTPITCPTLDGSLLSVRPPVSGITSSHGLTGGVYKARERIHRDVLIRDY